MEKGIDNIIAQQYKRMSTQSWFAGISAFVVGLIAHLFILTNEFANHDDVAVLWDPFRFSLWHTRWLQSICSPLVSNWGSGLMAGMFTLLILAISSVLLVDTFKIKSYALAIVTGAMMSASPIVACFMSYPNGSYLFVVGIPFAILAFRWYDKGIKGWFASSVCVMLAIAGYQSNICITIACIYVQLFTKLLKKEFDIKEWWKSFGKAFTMLVLGLIFYIISMQIIGKVNGVDDLTVGVSGGELTSAGYSAQSETGTLFISNVIPTISVAIRYFIKYHFNLLFDGANVSFASHVDVFANIIMTIAVFCAVGISVIKQKGILRKIMIIIVSLAAPMCINSTQIVLNGKCDETLQMMYSMIIVVPFVMCIMENASYVKEKFQNILISICFIMLLFHLYGNIQIINDAYQRMNSAYETAYSEMIRIMDRVEQTDEWQNGGRLLYFDYGENGGYLINDNFQAMTIYDNYIDMGWMGIFGTGVYNFWDNNNTSRFAKCYLGVIFDTPSEEQIMSIKESDEYDLLEKFPSINAVKVINGVVVVRMDD